MMLRIKLKIVTIVLFAYFVLFANLQAAEKCDLSHTPTIDGLYVGMSVDEFLAIHPTAEHELNKNKRKGLLDFPMENGKSAGKLKGISYFGHIATLDGIVFSFAISFLDEGGASYEMELDDFKKMLIDRYNLPKTGWSKEKENDIKLKCGDIEIRIHQDYGAAKMAIGPTLFVRNMRLAKINDSLE